MYRILHGTARGVARRIESVWDRVHLGARRRLGLIGPALILPYRKFGTPQRLRIGGRVVEDKGVMAAPRSNSTRENVRLTLKRYASNEIPGARVAFAVAGEAGEVVTNEEGFLEVDIDPAVPVSPPPGETWLGVKLTLVEAPHVTHKPQTAMADVLVPGPGARFGV